MHHWQRLFTRALNLRTTRRGIWRAAIGTPMQNVMLTATPTEELAYTVIPVLLLATRMRPVMWLVSMATPASWPLARMPVHWMSTSDSRMDAPWQFAATSWTETSRTAACSHLRPFGTASASIFAATNPNLYLNFHLGIRCTRHQSILPCCLWKQDNNITCWQIWALSTIAFSTLKTC